MRSTVARLLAVALLVTPGLEAQGTPTEITVRAVAHDAKIIGSGVGGARITIRHGETGAVLAEGLQEGSTGNTGAIMNPTRGETTFDTDGAAGFTTTLHLTRPTPIEIVAEGPLGTAHAMQRASRTLLMIPGQHLTGEGVSIVLSGFTVVIADDVPETVSARTPFRVTANVTMLCGCPTQPGGLWDSDDYTIWARMMKGDEIMATVKLEFTGQTSTYAGDMISDATGVLELQVLAVDRRTANTGMATRRIRVR